MGETTADNSFHVASRIEGLGIHGDLPQLFRCRHKKYLGSIDIATYIFLKNLGVVEIQRRIFVSVQKGL